MWAAPPPAPASPDKKDDKEAKPKSVQPKVEVGKRKGCHRYRWEFKDSNREFWMMRHAEVVVSRAGISGQGPKDRKRRRSSLQRGYKVDKSPLQWLTHISPSRAA